MIQPHDSVIVTTLSRLLIPLVQLYALYILFFGQYSPGGGFVAGVMLGASLILSILVFGPEGSPSTLAKKVLHGDGLGLIVFAGVGGLCLIGGGEFLNYSNLAVPGLEPSARRSLGIVLTQIGVALDVAVTAVSIVFSLAFIDHEEDSHV
ncbi:MAG: cation:proton antiporter [Acidobacteria bacterium]|nr:cation:proton antiporter [Acidobacteriota bacterium]MCI0721882.1 cation:proton antiporter [Acidobacteriota bacterium]